MIIISEKTTHSISTTIIFLVLRVPHPWISIRIPTYRSFTQKRYDSKDHNIIGPFVIILKSNNLMVMHIIVLPTI